MTDNPQIDEQNALPAPPAPAPEEREALEVEELLSECIGKGWRLAIHRTDPPWCAGYLDTWPLDGPLSLSDLREAYGGRRFRLKVLGVRSAYVRDFVVSIDDIPRRRGIPVKPLGLEFERELPAAPPAPATPAAPVFDIAGFLERANDRQLALMDRILEARAAPATAASATANPVEQIQALAEAVTKIREVSGMFGVEQDSTNNMLEMFMKLLDAKEKKDSAQERRQRQQPQRRQIAGPPGAPVQQQQQAGPPQQQNQGPAPGPPPGQGGEERQAPPLAAVPEDQAPEPEDIDPAELLAQYDPEEAGQAIRDYFEGLPPLEAQKALSAVLGQEVTLDDLSTLRAQSGHAAPRASAANHGPEGTPE